MTATLLLLAVGAGPGPLALPVRIIPPPADTHHLLVAVFDRWLLVAVRHNRELAAVDRSTHQVVARFHQEPGVSYMRVTVAGGRFYLAGEGTELTAIWGKDLSRLLAGVDVKTTGPVQVRLTTKGGHRRDRD